MSTTQEPPRDVVDARYRAKVAARAAGTTPVFEHVPPIDGTSDAPVDVEARFREKMARHAKPAAPKADAGDAKAKAKADQKPEKTEGEKPKADAGDAKRGG